MDAASPITRRALLAGLGACAGLVSGLSGAAFAATCPNACRSLVGADDAWIAGLPVIDAHNHIFNARDIPAIRFITKVFLPDYAVELNASQRRKLETEIGDYAAKTLGRTPGFEQEYAVLEARLSGEAAPEAAGAAGKLPEFARGSERSCYGDDVAHNITAVRNLVSILTGFRHMNFEALMATNAQRVPGVEVALYTPAMVDMDYWLGVGGEDEPGVGDFGTGVDTLRRSSPANQVILMEMIQRLYPGRCHGFVSFCPWRQADDQYYNEQLPEGSAHRRRTALETARDAILNRGFAGVKLYPPMGFLPLGNTELPLAAFPPAAAASPYAETFGARLDEAMLSLYEFCAAQHVPIMAHAAPSNGAGVYTLPGGKAVGYEYRAHPDGWARVLAQPGLSGLRLNLAHFGWSGLEAEREEWRGGIGALMDRYDNVYADLSHYPELLMDNFIGTGQHCREAAEMLEPIRKEFLRGAAGARRVRRMLYGSDWSMLSKEYYYADYLPVLAHLYRRKIHGVGQGAEANARAFLCGNAVRFLGLRAGEKARARLEAWYAANGLDPGLLARFDAVEG